MAVDRTIPSRETAELRHTLRTPINHIIGYAELLLEDSRSGSSSRHQHLSRILAEAQQILAIVQKHLQAGDTEVLAPDLDLLRGDLEAPVSSIVELTAHLRQVETGGRLIDVQRIRIAAEELQAFARGAEPKKPPASSHPASTSVPRESAPKLSARFLVVDDSELTREMLCRLLERLGHECTPVASGPEALALLRSHQFEIALLDVMMPEMNGVEVLRAIKCDEAMQDVAVVMLSALDETDDIGLCLEMGAEDYLLKPFDRIVLNARLNAILERKRLRNLERRRTAQLELADAELRRSNDELRRFASVVSHDLQEPLRMVTSYMQLLKRDLGTDVTETQKEFLDFAIGGARRMSELIHDLLAYSGVSAGAPHSGLVNFNAVLNDVKVNLRAAIEESNATILSNELPTLTADCSQVSQLLQNLLSNAIKYRSNKPLFIQVLAHKQEDQWLFSISDNGLGIDPANSERIFQMFLRLHDRTIPGTGIGLAICQRVVERLGGRIWVESAPGKGSTFFFTIPA